MCDRKKLCGDGEGHYPEEVHAQEEEEVERAGEVEHMQDEEHDQDEVHLRVEWEEEAHPREQEAAEEEVVDTRENWCSDLNDFSSLPEWHHHSSQP